MTRIKRGTRKGEKIGWSEFFTLWKEGINEISGTDQVKWQVRSSYIVLFGIFCGWAVSLYNYDTMWWVAIILTGAFINALIGLIGQKQRLNLLSAYETDV